MENRDCLAQIAPTMSVSKLSQTIHKVFSAVFFNGTVPWVCALFRSVNHSILGYICLAMLYSLLPASDSITGFDFPNEVHLSRPFVNPTLSSGQPERHPCRTWNWKFGRAKNTSVWSVLASILPGCPPAWSTSRKTWRPRPNQLDHCSQAQPRSASHLQSWVCRHQPHFFSESYKTEGDQRAGTVPKTCLSLQPLWKRRIIQFQTKYEPRHTGILQQKFSKLTCPRKWLQINSKRF